jgi:hypothetical protein
MKLSDISSFKTRIGWHNDGFVQNRKGYLIHYYLRGHNNRYGFLIQYPVPAFKNTKALAFDILTEFKKHLLTEHYDNT